MARRPRPIPRRGRFLDYPKLALTPAPPRLAQPRRRGWAVIRRGEFYPTPWPQIVQTPLAYVPGIVEGRRFTKPPRRRGSFNITPPTTVGAPVGWIEGRRLPASRGRSGRLWPFVPAQVILIPPPWAPPLTVRRRTPAGIGRSAFFTVIEASACDCAVHRPVTGSTSRPGASATTRPSGGITPRPCSC